MAMKCEDLNSKLAEFLSGEMDSREKAACDLHLASCQTCAREVRLLSQTWTRLGVLPLEQPSPALRQRFYGMLEAYQSRIVEEGGTRPWGRVVNTLTAKLWPRQPVLQFAMALAFLAIGLGAGLLIRGGRPAGTEAAQLQKNISDREQIMAISLLRQGSASERLQGISLIRETDKPGETMLNFLLDALNADPNVNVRLAAVEALYLFGSDPRIKDEIVLSLGRQESPLVQSALIDLLVSLREQRAVKALRQLIQDQKLNPFVKKKAAAGIQQLVY
jgi:hypothetical protein